MSIFRAYDIRGLVPGELDAELALRIGRATARFLGASPLVVGRDARTHSPELARALIKGLCAEGADVLDLGLSATPMLYHAVEHLSAAGGVMLTASHNPADWNGFKICRAHAAPVGGESGLLEIEALTQDLPLLAEPQGGPGRCIPKDPLAGYAEHVLSLGGACPPLRVAIDCGNGMAALGLEPLLESLPLEVKRLHFEPDGRFPAHPADPSQPENLRELQRAVRDFEAQLGVAFDGDADRAVFVDEQGAVAPSDLVMALLARARLQRFPGGVVLCDLRSSQAAVEEIRRAGGRVRRCRVGHSFVKQDMLREDAIFAGELSGHFYFRFSPTLTADDGIGAFVALLDILAQDSRPLSEHLAPLRRYFASGEISRAVGDAKQVERLLAAVADAHPDALERSWMDGLLVRYEDWWFSLRPSNTEPLLRLNLEARTERRMREEQGRLLAQIDAAL